MKEQRVEDLKILIIGGITDSHAMYDDGVRKRFGGGAMYGGVTAAQLGVLCKVLTIGADDIQGGIKQLSAHGVSVQRIATKKSNNFSNDYRGKRQLQMRSFAEKKIVATDVPDSMLMSNAVVLYPTFHEVSAQVLTLFPSSLRYVDGSGYMRDKGSITSEGFFPIEQSHWSSMSEFVGNVDVLKVSDEDLENFSVSGSVEVLAVAEDKAAYLLSYGFPIVLLTRSSKPPLVLQVGQSPIEVPIHPTQVKDPAGAGEVFGIGFVTEYLLTKDLVRSVAFANACAALKISGESITYEKAKEQAEKILQKG